jgi:uncharacterized protein YodC (DUF2158 family)
MGRPLKAGDTVRRICFPIAGCHDIGDVVVVTSVANRISGPPCIRYLDQAGCSSWCPAEHYEVIENPGEFLPGDMVQVVDAYDSGGLLETGDKHVVLTQYVNAHGYVVLKDRPHCWMSTRFKLIHRPIIEKSDATKLAEACAREVAAEPAAKSLFSDAVRYHGRTPCSWQTPRKFDVGDTVRHWHGGPSGEVRGHTKAGMAIVEWTDSTGVACITSHHQSSLQIEHTEQDRPSC